MRDLSAHDKHEYQKLMKDIDQKKSEITELGKTKEKLSARVDDMEQQIADLQEQVGTIYELFLYIYTRVFLIHEHMLVLVSHGFNMALILRWMQLWALKKWL